ncbi:MAG: hypothetical protein J5658_13410, partial [Prevotella sp.]|nr:hypothetical protein [Prevotella sp.]
MKKRFFALLMVLVMLMSLVPSTALAASTGESNAVTAVTYGEKAAKAKTDKAIFVGTDVHSSTSSLNSVLSTVSGDGIAYTVIGGDIQDSGNGSLSTYTSAITGALTSLETKDCYFTYGSHDSGMSTTGTNGFLDSASTGAVNLGTAWLWGISYDEMTNSSSASTAAAAFTSWVNGLASDDHKAIIIMSHVPIHQRRNDNPGGATWLSAINAAAESKDILFFWGHNHTGWGDNDSTYKYVAPGGSLKPQGGNNTEIKFTYALAGFIGQSANGAWKGSTVEVESDLITIKQYSLGSLSNTKTINRKDVVSVEDGTLLSLTLDTTNVKTAYTTDDTELDLSGLTVTANYQNVASQTVTNYTYSSNVDFSKTGTYYVTISYSEDTGAKAIHTVYESFEVTVTKASTVVLGGGGTQTVYVLSDTLRAGEKYLIVNANTAGEAYALTYDSTGTNGVGRDAVTIKNAEGDISNVYIEADEVDAASVWSAASQSSGVALTASVSGTTYYAEAYGQSSALHIASTQSYNTRYWAYSGTALGYYGGNATHYIQYSSNTFSSSTSSKVIYLFVETEISSQVTYEFTADNITARQNEDGSVDNRSISCELTANGTVVTPDTVSYEIESDADGIISGISQSGEITFNSNVVGTATVNVSYTYDTGDEVITSSKKITVKVLEYVEHHWSVAPHWDWVGNDAEGYTAATATFVCMDEGCGEVFKVDATINSESNTPSCIVPVQTVYTATVTGPDNLSYSESKYVGSTENIEAYVLVNSFTLGKDYLILNSNTVGTANALKNNSGSVSQSTVTILAPDDEVDTVYVLADENVDSASVWTATAHPNTSYATYPRLINGGYAVYPNSDTALALSSSLTATSGAVYTRYWTYEGNGALAGPSTNSGSTKRYMIYNVGFKMTTNSGSGIYIYEKQTVAHATYGDHNWVYSNMEWIDTAHTSAQANYTCSVCQADNHVLVNYQTEHRSATCERPDRTAYFAIISADESLDHTKHEEEFDYVPDRIVIDTQTLTGQTVYIPSTTIESGSKYLIVDTNAVMNGAHALKNNTSSVGSASVNIVEGVVNGDSQKYIINPDSAAIWTLTTSGNNRVFANGSRYLAHSSGNLTMSTNSSTWKTGTNTIYYSGSATRYLTYTTTWTLTTSSANVYLFKEVTNATITIEQYGDAQPLGHLYGESSHTEAKAPTCTEDGNIEYWTCNREGCGKRFATADTSATAVALTDEQIIISATSHSWGEPTYEWAEDHSSVTATRVCANDASHIETETALATMTAETLATCSEEGSQTWTSAEFQNGAFEAQTKTFATAIDANAHVWGEPTYEWAEDYSSVTATRVCAHDPEHKDSEMVGTTVTAVTPATCSVKGSRTWTSDEFANEAFRVQTETEELAIDANAHDWGEPTYEWAADHSSVTATRVCAHDPSHTETETVGATCTSLILATCTDEGSQTWVSDDFQNEAFAAKTETIVLPIEEEAHDWTFVDFTWMKTEDGYAAVANYVCGHDETHTKPVEATVTSEITVEATCEEEGEIVYTATDGENTEEKREVILPLDHDWTFVDFTWMKTEDGYAAVANYVCGHDETHTKPVEATVTSEIT